MATELVELAAGTRVRSCIDWRSLLFKRGEIVKIASTGPWVTVRWDDGAEQRKMRKDLIAENAPYPLHYHRCEWCGQLERCRYSCGARLTQYDHYSPEDFEANGMVLPGGYCDRDCYDHKRPRGCQHNMTEDGCPVDFPEF